ARLIGQRLTSILGQSIVIDNRPGAGGTIGARAVAESDPDGYTLLLGNTRTLVISPLIYRNVNYDPVKGFAPVAALGITSNLLIVNPALPVKSVQELIALARAKPGKLNYASAGIGTPPHLIGEMFKQRLGLDVVHIPYKGGGPSVAATVAGETQFSFENPASSLPLVEAGQVRALASTSDRRSSQMPDVPTRSPTSRRSRSPAWWRRPARPVRSSTGSTPPSMRACNRPRSPALWSSSASTPRFPRPKSSPLSSPRNATSGRRS